MLDISRKTEDPEKAIVYLDGLDARIFKQLLDELGSEEHVQNAMILVGLLAKASEGNIQISEPEKKEIKASFQELVGLSFEDFNRMLEKIKA